MPNIVLTLARPCHAHHRVRVRPRALEVPGEHVLAVAGAVVDAGAAVVAAALPGAPGAPAWKDWTRYQGMLAVKALKLNNH